jgi:hypothetical protein
MSRKIEHNRVGQMKVLVEFQRTEPNWGPDIPKHVALASSLNVAQTDWRTDKTVFRTKYNKVGRIIETYYLLWGPNDQYEFSGFTELRTPSGRKMAFKSALKIYQEAIKATEFMEFKKI